MSDTERGDPEAQARQPAPPLMEGLDWIGIGRELTLRELRGKVTVLDFWTYG